MVSLSLLFMLLLLKTFNSLLHDAIDYTTFVLVCSRALASSDVWITSATREMRDIYSASGWLPKKKCGLSDLCLYNHGVTNLSQIDLTYFCYQQLLQNLASLNNLNILGHKWAIAIVCRSFLISTIIFLYSQQFWL